MLLNLGCYCNSSVQGTFLQNTCVLSALVQRLSNDVKAAISPVKNVTSMESFFPFSEKRVMFTYLFVKYVSSLLVIQITEREVAGLAQMFSI